VPGRQIDGVVVVEATPRREPLRVVLPREGHNVGDLFSFRIYNSQNLPPLQFESDTRLWLQAMARDDYP
jgi:hypothetical protein